MSVTVLLPSVIAAVVLAAGALAVANALAPGLQLYGKVFTGTPGRGRKLALTFDDGPNPRCTPVLLELLRRHKVKATFFLVGRWVEQYPELARRIVEEGHSVGNHTWSHPTLIFCSRKRVEDEIARCEHALAAAGVPNPDRLFRLPRGARAPWTLSIVRGLGYTPVNWSITCYDWWPTTPERIAWHVMRQLRGGDVLDLHDGDPWQENADRTPTLDAVDALITRFKREGFELVTVNDWLRAEGALPAAPETARAAAPRT